jgi:hypothetical protein
MPIDVVAGSPRHRHLLKPGAQCELEADHAGAHRNGGLIWHAPPKVIVGGRFYGIEPWDGLEERGKICDSEGNELPLQWTSPFSYEWRARNA